MTTQGLTEVSPEALDEALKKAGVALETREGERLRVALPADSSSADALFSVAMSAGFRIEGLVPLKASLEQVFLETVAQTEGAA